MGKAIVFVSGKGGTGKTTAVSTIASCLAARGHKTLCIDCDIGLGNLDLALGLEDPVRDFGDVLRGTVSLEEAVYAHPKIPGLALLPAPVCGEAFPEEAMAALTAEAKGKYEFVLLDAPAGIGSGFQLCRRASDAAVIVTVGTESALRDGQRTAAILAEDGMEDVRLVVNRVMPRRLRRQRLTVDDMIDRVGAQLLGVIPEDEEVLDAAGCREALALYGATPAAKAFLRVSRRLCGETVPLGRI